MTRAARRLTLAVGTLALAPVLLAGPAYAATTPTPIASEPPGGATCAPGLPTTSCGQDQGTTPSPTPKPSSTKASTVTGASTSGSSTLPRTGSATLPRTGGGSAAPWGIAGAGVVALGVVLVAAGARPRSSD
jgi:hypothetical protein